MKAEREDAERRDPQHPADDHQQRVADRLEQADDRAAPVFAIRPSASANSTAKTTSGRMSPLVAAANTLSRDDALEEVGDARQRRRPPSARCRRAPLCSACGRAARQREQLASAATIITAPKIAEAVQMMTIHSTDAPAIRPPRAASALLAMPATSSATTSGMTVILSALSHSADEACDACERGSRTPSPASLRASARERRPTTSAASAQISAEDPRRSAARGAACFAQRGFRNLKMKRSVLPRILRIEHQQAVVVGRVAQHVAARRRARSPRA